MQEAAAAVEGEGFQSVSLSQERDVKWVMEGVDVVECDLESDGEWFCDIRSREHTEEERRRIAAEELGDPGKAGRVPKGEVEPNHSQLFDGGLEISPGTGLEVLTTITDYGRDIRFDLAPPNVCSAVELKGGETVLSCK